MPMSKCRKTWRESQLTTSPLNFSAISKRQIALARARGSDDGNQRTIPYVSGYRERLAGLFTSTDVVSPFCRDPVYNEKVISTLLGASLAVERKNIPCFA